MFKRNLALLSISSILTFPALAHEFSFGAGALNISNFATVQFTDTLIGGNPTFEWEAFASNITGEVYGGYAYNVNKGFDIGLEVFYDFKGPVVNQYEFDNHYISFETNNIIGVRVVPGFNITKNARVFFDVGYLWIESTINTTQLLNASDFTSSNSTNTIKRQGAIQYGAGFETMFYNNFGIRAMYSVTPSFNPNANNGTSVTSTDGTQTYSIKPSYTAFYLGGILRFSF